MRADGERATGKQGGPERVPDLRASEKNQTPLLFYPYSALETHRDLFYFSAGQGTLKFFRP